MIGREPTTTVREPYYLGRRLLRRDLGDYITCLVCSNQTRYEFEELDLDRGMLEYTRVRCCSVECYEVLSTSGCPGRSL